MDITDDLIFPRQPDDTRKADLSTQATAPMAASSMLGAAPPVRSFPTETVPIPPGLILTYRFQSEPPVLVALAPAPFCRLLFTILETAAGLALGAADEWIPSQAWLEKEELVACGKPHLDVPDCWNPPDSFLKLVKTMTENKLPAAVLAAVKSVYAETLAGFGGLTAARRLQAEKFLLALAAIPETKGEHRLLAAQPDSDGERFWATLAMPDGSIGSEYILCPLPALQELSKMLATTVFGLASKFTPNEEVDFYMANLAAGVEPESLNKLPELLIGLVIFAAATNLFIPRHRQRYLRKHFGQSIISINKLYV